MPRTNSLARQALPKLGPRRIRAVRKSNKTLPTGPRLFNDKSLEQRSQTELWRNDSLRDQLKKSLANRTHDDGIWRSRVSPDVAEFVDDMDAQGTKLLPEEQYNLITNPVKYFSRPQNVPNSLRKQVYFPRFQVSLIKSGHPYSAKFEVPTWFGKLDLKSYLRDVYNVEIVHVRSVLVGGRKDRADPINGRSQGSVIRGERRKYMTAQLVEPFTWPQRARDVRRADFEVPKFQKMMVAMKEEYYGSSADPYKSMVDRRERKAMAEQAKEILEGKAKWSPTWENFRTNRRMMLGERKAASYPANSLSG